MDFILFFGICYFVDWGKLCEKLEMNILRLKIRETGTHSKFRQLFVSIDMVQILQVSKNSP